MYRFLNLEVLFFFVLFGGSLILLCTYFIYFNTLNCCFSLKKSLSKERPTPPIVELHLALETQFKTCSILESLSTTLDCRLRPHFITLPHLSRTLALFFLPVLPYYNHMLPKRIPFTQTLLLMPKPPFCLSMQTIDQFTKCSLHSKASQERRSL